MILVEPLELNVKDPTSHSHLSKIEVVPVEPFIEKPDPLHIKNFMSKESASASVQ